MGGRTDHDCILWATLTDTSTDASVDTSIVTRSTLDRQATTMSIDRESTNVSVELPLMLAEVSTMTISGAYQSTTGRISVNYWQSVGRVSFDSRARVYQPICRSINRYYRPIYQPILDTIYWYIDQILPVLSTDTRSYISMPSTNV